MKLMMLKFNTEKEQLNSQIVMIKVILSPPRMEPSDFLIFKLQILKNMEVKTMNRHRPKLKC